jgi:hypothetical protein
MPHPSPLESVEILQGIAYATTILIHYTTPPFNDGIVPEDFSGCQAFLKTRS